VRVRIETLGCRVNRYDSAELRGQLAARGYEIVEEPGAPFDVYVLNSCTVTRAADAEARQRVARARRAAPSARLVVTGCYAETSPAEVAQLPVDLVVGNRGKPSLPARIDELLGRELAPPPTDPFPWGGSQTRFFLKVQEGCDVRCSFCVIPDARGGARSLDPDRVVALVRRAVERGYREVVLAGIHLGAYGRDLAGAPRLGSLLRRVLAETSIPRLRVGSLEPWGVREDLVALLADEPRFLPMLHLPLQSGSERILRAMRRPITAARYLELVTRLLEMRKELAIYLDVLVGFPGETDRDFAATLTVLDRFAWTKLHVFPYSARPGTLAANLDDVVPDAIKRERVRHLVDASAVRFATRMAARVGSTDEVLVESTGRGHTRDHFPCRVAGAAPGEIARVRIRTVAQAEEALLAETA
jgi:threonylcarbamoyladenosine tRNA methylthiotransferase MtaB